MKRTVSARVISEQRDGVFGLAILWIMLFHSSLHFAWAPLHLIKATGYCGVDIFLFLSGIGLYYSMEKDPSAGHFYKKRALRVLLPYLIVAVLYEGSRCLLGTISPVEFLANITFVSYWKNGVQTYWFIAAIVVFYAVYPLLYKVIKRQNWWVELLILTAGWGAALLLYQDQAAFYRINGLVFRIPIFLIGCFEAPTVKQGKEYALVPTVLLCIGMALLMWYFWIGCDPWFLRMYLFTPLSICLIWLGSIALSFLHKETLLQKILHFFGGMTLELYLVHEKVLAALKTVFPNHNLAVNAFAVALSIVLAWMLRRLCEKIKKEN